MGQPYKPVTSETVSEWIKYELSHAGVNFSLYEALISRFLSSSKARDIEIFVQDILKKE